MLFVPRQGKVNSWIHGNIIRNDKIKEEELNDQRNNTAMTKEIFLLLNKSRCKFQCYCLIIKHLFVSEVGEIYNSNRSRRNL